MVKNQVAGVAGQPLSIYVNGCDSPEAEKRPAETAGNPSDCRTLPRLSEREAKALNALAGCFSDEGNFLSFAAIAERSGLDPKHVRRTVRALARKGLAAYGRGLWCWNGDGPAGAGYCCTPAGYDAAPEPKEYFND